MSQAVYGKIYTKLPILAKTGNFGLPEVANVGYFW